MVLVNVKVGRGLEDLDEARLVLGDVPAGLVLGHGPVKLAKPIALLLGQPALLVLGDEDRMEAPVGLLSELRKDLQEGRVQCTPVSSSIGAGRKTGPPAAQAPQRTSLGGGIGSSLATALLCMTSVAEIVYS